jgi:hypothetical protein
MKKLAFVKLQYEDQVHRIPATDAKEEGIDVVIYNGDQVVGRFDLNRVQHWALELAEKK